MILLVAPLFCLPQGPLYLPAEPNKESWCGGRRALECSFRVVVPGSCLIHLDSDFSSVPSDLLWDSLEAGDRLSPQSHL